MNFIDVSLIDQTINKWENDLSTISAFPVAGTLAGGAKILMGLTQTITAVVSGIFLIIPSLATGDLSPLSYAWTHITHGLGNMVAGTFEAIPIIATAIYFMRQISNDSTTIHITSLHANKFMPYPSLVERDWRFGGTIFDVQTAQRNYEAKVEQIGGADKISRSRKFELAKATVKELDFD